MKLTCLSYFWQLPQNLVGLILWLYFRLFGGRMSSRVYNKHIWLYVSKKMRGAISLGNIVFVSEREQWDDKTVKHELGHCKQSQYLGWLYLPVVGFSSLIHAWLYKYNPADPNGYYRYWCEAWADRLGGVRRE